ncbi:hypothetical protein EXIGLDRAFT_92237 [Exidia glandulosa HHB12029]|uniref:DUF6533 domain-containing protein n=1 Tax=Exidia glandulosa HHB12029 TaxID=1314781 RepID=A0A165H9K7_EXIGL|nr:hypothetical protein EXIGLDRAFT_92237 [Exidia glandulosa HHB12029]
MRLDPSQAADLLELFRKGDVLIATQYSHIAAASLLWWDYLLTLPQEIEFFWQGRLSWPAILFFVNRYLPILTETFTSAAITHPVGSDAVCKFFIAGITPWTGALEIFIAQSILLARLCAVYGNKRSFAVRMIAFFALTTAAVVGIFIWNEFVIKVTSHPFPGYNFTACLSITGTAPLYLIWIPVLLFESVAFALLMHMVVRQIKEDHRVRFSRKTLLHVILRDNIIYFVIILVLYMTEAMMWRFMEVPERELIDGPSVALISIMGNRMLLNIRRRNRANACPELLGTLTAAADAMLSEADREARWGGTTAVAPDSPPPKSKAPTNSSGTEGGLDLPLEEFSRPSFSSLYLPSSRTRNVCDGRTPRMAGP